jgi:2-methylcitrate dehydratase PrpD
MGKTDQTKEDMCITKQLADFVCGLDFQEIPPEVVRLSKDYIMDGIGVSIFGSTHANSKKIKSYVKTVGGAPHASVIGNGFKTSSPMAALANGYMAHVNDWDDTMTTMRAHPTATIFPAVLALGEMLNISGAKIIEGYIAGVEIAGKIGRGINPEHSKHWHATGTLGCLGAAAGSTKILGFDADATRSALGIAASEASGLRKNKGTSAKPFHAGNAARGGVMAALLVREGLQGNLDILEGQFGFCNVYCGEEHYQLKKIIEGLGDPFEIYSPGIDIKPYPCCSRALTGIDAILSLSKAHRIKPEEVERIDCGVSYTTPLSLIHPIPKTGLEGQFSMGFCVAVALVDQKVGPEQFTDEKVNDPRVQELLKKFHLYIRPDLMDIESSALNACTLKVRLQNGKEYTKRVDKNKGSTLSPLNKEEKERKFRDCAKGALPDNRIDDCLDMIEHMGELKKISQLTDIIRN